MTGLPRTTIPHIQPIAVGESTTSAAFKVTTGMSFREHRGLLFEQLVSTTEDQRCGAGLNEVITGRLAAE